MLRIVSIGTKSRGRRHVSVHRRAKMGDRISFFLIIIKKGICSSLLITCKSTDGLQNVVSSGCDGVLLDRIL